MGYAEVVFQYIVGLMSLSVTGVTLNRRRSHFKLEFDRRHQIKFHISPLFLTK